MKIKLVATCLTAKQEQACAALGVAVVYEYTKTFGDIVAGCVTDFSVHCFNSQALAVLKGMGVARATLHPELNLAQIRDIAKCMDTEVVVYGKLPLMRLGSPIPGGTLRDRKGVGFFVQGEMLYNSVPIFMADKLGEIEKAGVTHGRICFTTESAEEVQAVVKAYLYRKAWDGEFTRGKFYSKV